MGIDTKTRLITYTANRTYRRRRKVLALAVIIIVVISLFLSISVQQLDTSEKDAREKLADPPFVTAQIIISTIVILASFAELTGLSVREIFSSYAAKENIEEFPFHVIQDFDTLFTQLFPDPKTPLISDREIPYLPRISIRLDNAYQQSNLILIGGRSKTGKTREACELLRRWWYTGPTVLLARNHVRLRPPYKIPENLPIRNLILFFDDIDKYLNDFASLKLFEQTIEFFQQVCHGNGELQVIATARLEEEFWKKLNFDHSVSPWNKFEFIELHPLTTDLAESVIDLLSEMSGIGIDPSPRRILAQKNDGTFLNLVLTFRRWKGQGIESINTEELKMFDGFLKNNWRRRYEEYTTFYPEIRPIYAAVGFMQAHGIPLIPDIINELATLMGTKRWLLVFAGLPDRIEYWIDTSRAMNIYRRLRQRTNPLFPLIKWGLVIYIIGFLFYRLPGPVLFFILERLESPTLGSIILLLIAFAFLVVLLIGGLLISFASDLALLNTYLRVKKALNFLLSTEVPMHENELSPYEGQFEGNGNANNWDILNYSGDLAEQNFKLYFSQKLISKYLSLAEQLRVKGENHASKTLTRFAMRLCPDHPAAQFMLGKIEFDENNYKKAFSLYAMSRDVYDLSDKASYVEEWMALSFLLTGENAKAEDFAGKALRRMPSLPLAAWTLGLAQLQSGKIKAGFRVLEKVVASQPKIPAEIQKALIQINAKHKKWYRSFRKAILPRSRTIRQRFQISVLPALRDVLPILILFCMFLLFQASDRLQRTNLLIKLFPNSSILLSQRCILYNSFNDYQKALADCDEVIRMNQEFAAAYNNRGYVHATAREYQKALYSYNEAIRLNPTVPFFFTNRGNTFYALEEYEQAFADYDEAIRIDQENDTALNKRGYAYYTVGEYEKALEDYTKAVAIEDSQNQYDYSGRGDVYIKLEEYEKAIADYSEAIHLDPENAAYFIDRGNAYYGLEQYDKAVADYTEAIRLDPENPVLFNNRGDAYRNLDQYDKAVADYTEAIRLDPENAAYFIDRGNAYYGLEQYDKAVADYTEAIHLDPENDSASNKRGYAYYTVGEYEKALEDYTKAVAIEDSQNQYDYSGRGDVYIKLEEYEKAIADYSEAIRIEPVYTEAYNKRGNAYYNLEQYEQAIPDYSEAIRLDPENAVLFNNRGDAYRNLDQYDKAVADYTEAIRLDPENASYYDDRGDTYYYGLNKNQFAIDDYAEAIRLDPKNYRYYNDRGNAYYNLAQYEMAISDYAESIGLAPNDPVLYKNRGDAYRNLEQYQKAITDYTKAIQLDPEYADAYSGRGLAFLAIGNQVQADADLQKYDDLKDVP